MTNAWIDLRSDTVTRPSNEMRAAMNAAEVGDDVYKEDPTVIKLEEQTAAMMGHEAALFCPSGTMSNQICIKAHTQPADEMICEEFCHVFNWEGGGPAALSNISCKTIRGNYGLIEPNMLLDAIRPPNDHYTKTRLLTLENTHNRCGGRVQPLKLVQDLRDWTRKNNLIFHLDGARLWNAIVATGIEAKTWGKLFDSVSVCFSKGLGAPIGSAIVGSKEFVASCRRIRKRFGGGMRQAGTIAAGALYALNNNIGRLKEDHEKAKLLGEAIKNSPGLKIDQPDIETNIVWFRLDQDIATVPDFVAALKERKLLIHTSGSSLMRVVTHLDASMEQVKKAAEIIHEVTNKLSKGKI
jgi:threonine aldolase